MISEEKAKELIAGTFWKFAKTMSWTPHWYCLRENFAINQDFDDLWNFVKEYSQPVMHSKKMWMVCNIDEYRYWVMCDNSKDAVLINRTFIDPELRKQVDIQEEIRKNDEFRRLKKQGLK